MPAKHIRGVWGDIKQISKINVFLYILKQDIVIPIQDYWILILYFYYLNQLFRDDFILRRRRQAKLHTPYTNMNKMWQTSLLINQLRALHLHPIIAISKLPNFSFDIYLPHLLSSSFSTFLQLYVPFPLFNSILHFYFCLDSHIWPFLTLFQNAWSY